MGKYFSCFRPYFRPKPVFQPDTNYSIQSCLVPSLCSQPSTAQVEDQLTGSDTSLDAETLRSIMFYSKTKELVFTPEVFLATKEIVDKIRFNLLDICGQLSAGIGFKYVNMDAMFVEKFERIVKDVREMEDLDDISFKELSIRHFALFVIVHKIILNHLECSNWKDIHELLKQITICHALRGVTIEDFAVLDLNIIEYLIHQRFVDGTNVDNIIIYMKTFTNCIRSLFITQANETEEVYVKRRNDLHNKARENYRLMRKWNNVREDLYDELNNLDSLSSLSFSLANTLDETYTVVKDVCDYSAVNKFQKLSLSYGLSPRKVSADLENPSHKESISTGTSQLETPLTDGNLEMQETKHVIEPETEKHDVKLEESSESVLNSIKKQIEEIKSGLNVEPKDSRAAVKPQLGFQLSSDS